jgi:hypothetical protein
MNILVITSSMPGEVSLAAVAEFMGSRSLVIPIQSINNVHFIEEEIMKHSFFDITLDDKKELPKTALLFIGSYWNKDMLAKMGNHFVVDRFNSPEIPTKDEAFANAPHFFLANYIVRHGIHYQVFDSLILETSINHQKRLFTLLDQRYNSENILETEKLFSGLYFPKIKHNEERPAIETLKENVLQILQQRVTLDEVIERGSLIVEIRMNLAHERVLNNSSVRTLSNGERVAIVNAPDLVNITHDALHKKYPNVPLTATFALQLKNEKVELSISLRSQDMETPFDLKKLVSEINQMVATPEKKESLGMPNDKVSGGRIDFPQFIQVLEDIRFLAKK